MSKADYPYPEDEFDAISPDAPTGVHRAPRSAWSRWWPFVLVLVLVPALAYGAVAFLSRTGDVPLVGGPTQGQEEPGGEELPADGTGEGEATPEGEGQDEETPPETETTTPPPAPQLDVPVVVLNGARVSGLAGRVAEELEGAGFVDVKPDNATEPLPPISTVYVASPDLQTTGELVATTVGVSAIVVDPEQAGLAVTLVLVTDPDA
ncbi:conserved hypothetical protein [Cellulomonas flavigena DSM 20109]|uniref:LytR/CpsA/Psr regulator C-terminal domain-containing protein n=1 Tax=Cellulomonas flavigena (strain ATCC 482 / DSM 20109 / BCRC 11376 / JCM 18109 / NBRC 3775 / NCIMB 8073 / NRS 134) TaxID=446466 RepID=D5UJ76_CELFN|nr:LytR C-terminal domain-containing protein [Cellulomonas flavigena]ADG73599.1 conserved hypothetical protein [Cellulomonas flavigena DSM 20109]